MRVSYVKVQITWLFLLSMIPWPGPSIFKISCPRGNARIVQKIVQNKWVPILEKFKVKLPLDCPFHPKRDIFSPQQDAKFQHRPSQWTCGLCGKSFFEEKFLDMHFDNRHRDSINMAEDAVCLADYCDIMRCDVVLSQDPKAIYPENTLSTDIEVWRETMPIYNSAAMSTSASKDLTKYASVSKTSQTHESRPESQASAAPIRRNCNMVETSSENNESSSGENSNSNEVLCQEDLVDAALPAPIPDNKQQRLAELQKLKANCKPEELQKMKIKCEILVRDCIAGLIIQLSSKDFKEVEDELNRAVCWYLTCDRYWEDANALVRIFPWGLLCMILMVLFLGVCLCYYVIWVLFDSSPANADKRSQSPGPQRTGDTYHDPIYAVTDETGTFYLAPDKDNEYIYVTYPPELKRRLLESCYNRTTRL